jgi:hypothetical protein
MLATTMCDPAARRWNHRRLARMASGGVVAAAHDTRP